jgi:hypothetical protein
MFQQALSSQLLLAFLAVPVVSCAAVGLAVDVLLPLLFRPWSPCYAAFITSVEISAATGVSIVPAVVPAGVGVPAVACALLL